MKTLTAIAFFVLFAGSVNAQEGQNRPAQRTLKVTTTAQTAKPVVNDGANSTSNEVRSVQGIVRTASCGTYIEVNVNDEIHRYFPVGLNPKMHIEGYSILFDYVEDTTAFPENCDIIKSVRVNNVRYNGNN